MQDDRAGLEHLEALLAIGRHLAEGLQPEVSLTLLLALREQRRFVGDPHLFEGPAHAKGDFGRYDSIQLRMRIRF